MVTMQQYAQTDYSTRDVLRFDTSSTKILVPLLPNSRNNLVHVSTFSRKVKKKSLHILWGAENSNCKNTNSIPESD